MSETEELARIGLLAVAMQRARLKVEAWMNAEGAQGNFRYNDQCPDWPAYVKASEDFQRALVAIVDTLPGIP